ncbi:hypothetical protein V8B55DRAFT_1467614, partial [Mucor lusitanicus]
MLFNKNLTKKNKPRKLQYDWIGSMTVTKVLSNTRYSIICNMKIKNTRTYTYPLSINITN